MLKPFMSHTQESLFSTHPYTTTGPDGPIRTRAGRTRTGSDTLVPVRAFK